MLTDLDLLHDGSVPEIRSWIERVICNLTPGFIDPVRQWLLVLLNGDTRADRRSSSSIYVYFGCVRPFLDDWAAGYDHLREVTRSDIHAVLGPLNGSRRHTATSAVRSLFGFAKKRGLILANPTTGLKGRPADFALPRTSRD
ncbi:hypothetical protein [Streptosporangium pseudovulgare]|uniref:hypothetical protein n=1 Tax=Streptosporangium pseudovulgare TaxID=35765 RepID=UPI0016703813|nr:hypothetical protein [Streptosporangium pseudovulgare]